MTTMAKGRCTSAPSLVERANHYHIGITAWRVRKPRGKGPVESAVNQLYQYVYARIQDEVFYTLDELNARLWEILREYVNRPYKGRTRWQIFVEDEKPTMPVSWAERRAMMNIPYINSHRLILVKDDNNHGIICIFAALF